MKYETVIGLEVHVQLNTKTKVFCGCLTQFGAPPNTNICPVCLGFPGSLPVLNKLALEYAIKVAIALNCQIQSYTKFDRKHYYYPDLPKNYQISQYDLPLAKDGYVQIELDNTIKKIGIRRIHLEEDAGKLIHAAKQSFVDYNRAGIPLLEIVSQPDINSPQEAYEYLKTLKNIIEYLDVSTCDMEKGSLRCDANISLRPAGTEKLGTKIELKNMNSFKAVRDALTFEVARQTALLEQGIGIVQETRLWDEKTQQTYTMRTKEEAQDYRYFPEPDLPPFVISQQEIDRLRKSIPALPAQRIDYLMQMYNLSKQEAKILATRRGDIDFAQSCLAIHKGKEKKTLVNWLLGPLMAEANERKCDLTQLGIKPSQFVELVALVEEEKLSNISAKMVLTKMLALAKSPLEIAKESNLLQVSDAADLKEIVEEVIKANPKSVADFKQGKENAIMFLVGQAMRHSKGKANPKLLQEIIRSRLQNEI